MRKISYGYKIENGEIKIEKEEADRVRKIFGYYLQDNSLAKSAELAGLKMSHGSVKRMLTNRRYIGDQNYPLIINKECFEKVGKKIEEKAKSLGRVRDYEEETREYVPTEFIYEEVLPLPVEPLERANFQYTLIQRKVNANE